MNRHRRTFLQGAASAGLVATAIAAGLLKPGQVLADWNAAGFGATKTADALAAIGGSGAMVGHRQLCHDPDGCVRSGRGDGAGVLGGGRRAIRLQSLSP